jgi:hypothetical protein
MESIKTLREVTKAGGHSNRLLGSLWHPSSAEGGKWTPSRRPDGIPDWYYEQIVCSGKTAIMDAVWTREFRRHSTMICHVPAAVRVVPLWHPYKAFCCVAFYLVSQKQTATSNKSLLAFPDQESS